MKIIRWILFLPIAVIASAIISGFVNWISHWMIVGVIHWILPKAELITNVFSCVIWGYTGIITAASWMSIGYKVAPVRNTFAKWFLLIPLFLVLSISLLGFLVMDDFELGKHVPVYSVNPKTGAIILYITALITWLLSAWAPPSEPI